MHSRRLVPVLLLIAVAVAVAAFLTGCGRSDGGLEMSGTVEATEAELGFTSAGRIEAMNVREGDTVSVGAELARLDRSETQAKREQAQAQADAARATLAQLQRGARPEEVAQARAATAAAQEKLEDAKRDDERTRRLHQDQLASEQEMQKSQTALQLAGRQYDMARESQRLVEKGPRREEIDAQRATLAAAEASVRNFDAMLANMIVRAPYAGVVTVRQHEPGEIVQAGAAAVTLLNRNDRWVKVYVPETRIGAVHVGQAANITTDTYKGRTFGGTVSYVAPEAEFTPKTVQTREERVKLVYAVKVRITGDPAGVLKPGMPADVVLEAAR
jgi:HlyD family secretion protein